ncbi:hypothetical protein [Nitrospira sp. Kam-Ns4a]
MTVRLFIIGLVVLGPFWLFPGAGPVEAGCRGLQGEAYERCLKGKRPESVPLTVTFFDAQGTPVAVDRDVVSRSMAEVCKAIGRDGLFQAYRNDGDRRQARIWKEVECRGGRVHGLWREYFPSEDTLTILSYDESGRAVKQALYLGNRLISETPLGKKQGVP